MNAFFFGSSKRQLFGAYHPPASGRARKRAVVLCYPWGQEYLRAHRAFRRLTALLGSAGVHVLRFDYAGTGDSAGEGTDATIATAVEDIGTAIDELKDMSGIPRVGLVGLRLGAMLGAMAATGRRDVDSIVMWDPVLDGREYIEELLRRAGGTAPSPDMTVEVDGFALTPAIRTGLAAVTPELGDAHGRRMAIVVSRDTPTTVRFVGDAEARKRTCAFEHIPAPQAWLEERDSGAGAIPVPLLERLVAHVA